MIRYLVFIYNDDGTVKEYRGITEHDKMLITRAIAKKGYRCVFKFRGRYRYIGPGKCIAFERSPACYVDEIITYTLNI